MTATPETRPALLSDTVGGGGAAPEPEFVLPLWRQLAYAFGSFHMGLLPGLLGGWLQLHYCQYGADHGGITYMDVAVYGMMWWLAARTVEALANPFVGYFSDAAKTPWGRRMPFIVGGMVPMLVAFAWLWFPPVPGRTIGNVVFASTALAVYFASFVAVVAPYLALLPEITPHNRERVRISVYMGIFELLGVILGFVVGGFVIEHLGMNMGQWGPWMLGPGAAVLAMFSVVAPLVAVRERPQTEGEVVPFRFGEAMRRSFANPPFATYVTAFAAFRIAVDIILFSVPFLVTVALGKQEGLAGTLQGLMLIVGALLFPVIDGLVPRLGKKRLCEIGLWMLVAVFSVLYFARSAPFLAFLMRPLTDWLGITDPFAANQVLEDGTAHVMAAFLFAAFPIAVFNIVPRAMLADIIDHDETLTGHRREAMYNGVEGLVTKFFSGLSVAVGGWLLATYGKTMDNPEGILLCGPFAALCLALAGVVFRRYPIRE